MIGQLRQFTIRLLLASSALIFAAFFAGCFTTESWVAPYRPLPDVKVAQIAATWENQVFMAPNIASGGQPTPALSGRLYLFGPEVGRPLLSEGQINVTLFAERPVEGSIQLDKMESWQFSDSHLKKMERKDFVGWGYNLALPWGKYDPNVQHVQLLVSFTPAGGAPLYSRSRLKVQHQKRQFQHRQRVLQPGSLQPPMPPQVPPPQKPWTGPMPAPQGQPPMSPSPLINPRGPVIPLQGQAPYANPAAATEANGGEDQLRRIIVPRK